MTELGHRARELPWRWIIALMVLGLAAVTIWALFFSTLFAARTVEVVGNRQVSTAEVLSAAGVSKDVPLIRVQLDSIAERVEGLDAVASVTVERRWPDTVRLLVTERTPVAQVVVGDGVGVLGSDGSLYRSESDPVQGLPVLLGDWPTAARSITDPSIEVTTNTAFAVAKSLPAWLRRDANRIDAQDADRIEITLDNGAQVQWGSIEFGQRKSEVLRLLLSRQAAVFDVSVPDAPAWSG